MAMNSKAQSVLHLLRKQVAINEKFCDDACVERFLKARGDNVKRAAKLLKNCLAWRHTIRADNMMADEFTAELIDGVAYVAGYDAESRPVVIFRIKQDYPKIHSHKLFTRLVAFTFEVAVQAMAKNVDQFVLLFDASSFKSGSSLINIVVTTLKIVADYYPCRLHKAFVIDPPSLFSYLWKGVKAFVELSGSTQIVSSLDYEDKITFNDFDFKRPATATATSLRFDSAKFRSPGSSSRFTFTVSQHGDSLKPWYLSFTESNSGAAISPFNGRSLSFESPAAMRKGLMFPSTPMPHKSHIHAPAPIRHARTPKPSFLRSPVVFFRHESRQQNRESFEGYLKFYRRPYDEMSYRAKMKAPLGGLISIVSPQIRRRHVSLSQRF